MDQIIEKIRRDRVGTGNNRSVTVITVNTLHDLLDAVRELRGAIIVLYEGSDAKVTVGNWNQIVRTNYPIVLLSSLVTVIDPTESEYYEPYILVEEQTELSPELPRLSQCDPVCRWLGFQEGDIVRVGDDLYQVYDDHDKYFLTDFGC